MEATSAKTPRRFPRALLAVALWLAVWPGLWAADESEASDTFELAWSRVETTGTVGSAELRDTMAAPGATCRNDLRSNPPFVDITTGGPTVSPATGYTSQVVGWRAVLSQILPGDVRVPLATSGIVTMTATAEELAVFTGQLFPSWPLGPAYVIDVEVLWYAQETFDVEGAATYRVEFYRPTDGAGASMGGVANACVSPLPPVATLPIVRGTVNSAVGYSLRYFPIAAPLALSWDGRSLGSVTTDARGQVTSAVIVPAAPLGNHTVRWSTGSWSASAVFTVAPRIKVTPSLVSRGQTVNVSLRGFGKKEMVRIRWKRGSSYVEVDRVLTSNSGSANVNIIVPAWAPDGATSVRGDGPIGRAQTNVVEVQGGRFRAAEEPATATPSPTATVTATAMATATPTVTALVIATTAPTADASPESAESPTPEPTPTSPPEPTATPTESPTPAPTATPPAPSPPPALEVTETPVV